MDWGSGYSGVSESGYAISGLPAPRCGAERLVCRFRVWGLGFRIWGLGLRASGLGFWVLGGLSLPSFVGAAEHSWHQQQEHVR